VTHFFNLTPGTDNLTGLPDDYNAFQLTPATLQSGDTVTGGAAGTFYDVLVVTAAGTILSSQFANVTNIEQLNLFSGGNNVSLTNGLVAGTSTGSFAILDGGGNDTIDASAVSAKPVVFYAAGGSDTFKGGSGNDAIVIAAADLTSADTIQGGAGIDNLYFSTAGTVAASAFTNVSGIEGIGLSSLGNSIALLNSMVVSSDNGGFAVADGAGDDTVDASGITSGTAIAFFASGGSDTFRGGNGPNGYVFAAADLTSADTVTGGTGSADNLFITTAGTLSAAAFTNVTGIEGLVLANGTNNVTLTNGLVAGTAAGYFAVAGGTGNDTVNASGVTNGTAIAFYGTTGGNDAFTGGNGNDAFLFGAGQLTSADTVAGGGGNDTIWMTTAGTTTAADLAGVSGVEGVFLQSGGTFNLANGITGAATFAAVGSSAVDTFDASAVTGYKVTFTGNGGADVLKGGSQDDTFFIADSAFASINGNGGIDRITLTTPSQTFNLTANAAKISNLEVIDLDSSNSSALIMAGTDIAQVNASGNSLYVIGDVDDIVNAGNGYTQIASGVVNNAVAPGHTFFEYQHSSGSLLFIDSAITAQTATTGNDSASVPEGTAAGATVFDAGMAGATTYVLGGADAALFSIDGAGHISFNASPDFEAPQDQGHNNVYDLTVTTSNGTATPNFVETVAITVTDVNDNAPVFTSGAAATTPENVATTTPVYTAHATDADAGNTVTYTLASGGDNALFDINSTTGAVTFKASPDFDNPQDAGHDNTYDIGVIATDGVPAHNTTKAVAITVTDLNENPVITSNGGGDTASVNVNENSTAVTTVTATDPDVPAQTLTYSVLTGAGSPDGAKFTIDGSGHLSFISAPDFEAPGSAASSNSYTVQVQVADNGVPTMHDIQTITVNVQDLNDNAPVFTSGATATTPENVATTTPVYTAHATDADAGNTVTYTLASGGDNALFDINSTTGAVTFKASPDFDNPQDAGHDNTYDIGVIATDGVPAHNTTKAVAITVTDLNENPVITSNGGGDTASVNVNENSTAVTTVTATDPDVPAQTLTYSVLTGAGSPDGAKFTIDGSGHLSFISAPDFEAPGSAASSNSYTVQVQVADNGVPTMHDIQTITVNVQDVNDIAPTFTSNATPTVIENSTAVVDLATTDADTVGTNPATFSINAGLDGALFTITGGNHLAFAAPRDYETQAHSYAVDVTASDGTNTTVQHIVVGLADDNDNAPIFSSATTASTPENVATTTPVYTAIAPDADGTAANNTVHYTLAAGGDNDLFDIDANSGAVTFKASPDFEAPADAGADNQYDITVTASDGLAAHNTTQAVAITVTDENDNAPVFGSPTGAAIVDEGTSTATVVFDASATDADGTAANNTIAYSLGGTDGALFNINSATGEVTFAASPNFETPADAGADNHYDITVTASDGVPAHDATQAVTITVADVAPSTPVDSDTATADSVSQHATVGTYTGITASSTDVNGPAVTWSLTNDTSGGGFGIDSTGKITVIDSSKIVFNPADATHEFSVRAIASDGTLNSHQDFTITVVPNTAPTANDDAASATEAGGLNNTVAGTDPTGNVITPVGPGDVADTDPDAGDSVTVVAAGTGTEAAPTGPGTVNTAFNGQHGSLLIHTDGSYTYTVDQSDAAVQALRTSGQTITDSFNYTIQDNGGLQDVATLTVTIHGANDNPIANADSVVAVEAGGVANGTPGTNPGGNVITGAGTAGAVADTDVDSAANGETTTVVGVATGSPGGPLSGNVGVGVASLNGYGTLTIGADGTYSYVVDNTNTSVQALRTSAQTLTDTFSYTISDAAGVTSTTTVTVTIDGANDAPVAHADVLSATEAGGVGNGTPGVNPSGNVITGSGSPGAVADTDADTSGNGEVLSVVGLATGTQSGPLSGNVGGAGLVSANGYGTLTIGTDGTYSYVVDNSNAAVQALRLSTQTLTDTFSYTLSDAAGATSTTTVTITIHGANDNPVANADAFTAIEAGGLANGTAGSNPSGNVLTGTGSPTAVPDTDVDSSANGETTTVVGVAAGSPGGPISGNVGGAGVVSANGYGTLTIAADGTYGYVLNNSNATVQGLRTSAQTLTDTFSYTISDAAGAKSTTTVTITIDGANDNPVANDDNVTATETSGTANGTAGHNPTGNLIAGTGGNGEAADTDVDTAANGETTTVQGVAAGNTGTVAQNVDPGTGIDVVGAHGTLHVNANGTYTYTVDNTAGNTVDQLNTGGSLSDTFTYTVKDTAGATSTAHVNVTVHGADDAPVATADSYVAFENRAFTPTAATGVLANDTDVDTAHTSLTAVLDAGNGPSHAASFTLNADGSFSYTPTAGYLGGDSFTYHTSDGSLTSSVVTVSLDVQPLVWHIDNTAAAGGDGTAAHPFNSIAAFNTANSAAGVHPDIVYLHSGTGTYTTTDGINLNNGQTLLGQGVDLTYTTSASAPGGAHVVTLLDADNSVTPTIQVTGGTGDAGVTLAQNNTLSGFNISTTNADGIGIEDSNAAGTAGSVGTLHIDTVGISGVGKAIDIDQGGTLSNVHLTSIASTGSNSEGIQLGGIAGSTLGGSFTVDGTTSITNADTTGIQVSNTAANASFNFGSSTTVTDSAVGGHTANGIDFTNTIGTANSFTLGTASITTDGGFGLAANGGTVNIGGTLSTINATGGAAIDLTNTSLGSGATFSSVSSTNSTGTGIQITGLSTGNFTANGGAISNATGTDVSINTGTSSITYNGTITDDVGQLVSVANKSGGTVAFGGAITDGNDGDGNGISLTNNTGATINFTGGTTLSTGANAAFTATGGGTVTITGTNHLTTTTGTALNVSNTFIGSSGLTFQDISANGGTNGIVLNGTGTAAGNGGLTVTGTDGADAGTLADTGTGGTIQHTTGDSISLNGTKAVSLAGMNITSSGNGVATNDNSNWIDASNVLGLTLLNMNASHSVGHGINGNGITNLVIQGGSFIAGGLDNDQGNFNGVNIHNLLGTSSVTGADFEQSNTIQFRVNNDTATNFNGTPDTLTVSGTTFQNHNVGAFFGDHLSVNSDTGGNFRLIVDNSAGADVFKTAGIAVQATAGGTNGKMDAQISGITSGGTVASGNTNTSGVVIGETGTGSITYDIHDNTILGSGSVSIAVTHAAAGGTSSGKIHNNTITHIAGAGTDALAVNVQGVGAVGGTGTVSIENNTITGNYQRGIVVQAGQGNPVLNATIDNNHLTGTDTTGNALQQLDVEAGLSGGGSASTVRLNMFNNDVHLGTGASYLAAYRLVERSGNTFQLQDFTGNGSSISDIQNWVTNVKTNTGTPVLATIGAPFTASVGPIPTPLLSAPGGVEASSPTAGETHLDQTQLNSAVAAALALWTAAGLSPDQVATLQHVTYDVADITSGWLGQSTPGHVTIDANADGYGWFVDTTPLDNSEFAHAASASDLKTDPSTAAAGHMDLLTTVVHEMGEQLGLDDSFDATDQGHIDYAYLTTGERVLATASDVAQINAVEDARDIEASLPSSAQAAIGTAIVAATVGNDTINAGSGGNVLFGGAGADNFVFGPSTPLNAPTPAQVTHVADYSAAQGDTFDFSAITSAFHNSNVSDSLVVRAVEDSSGKFAMLQVDHIDPNGLPAAPNWVNVAQLDGAHAGDAVNVLIDNHSVHVAQIHVDLLV